LYYKILKNKYIARRNYQPGNIGGVGGGVGPGPRTHSNSTEEENIVFQVPGEATASPAMTAECESDFSPFKVSS